MTPGGVNFCFRHALVNHNVEQTVYNKIVVYKLQVKSVRNEPSESTGVQDTIEVWRDLINM